ncbi:hypothetical protein JF546_14905 [Nitratireductor aquimarinus]|uniref:hypothetical protein n=1 Tax=Nitratireductor aquimarinus TaxID=889300 RepID=UPI001A8D6DB2|nr:hypothetical protein [Nitratireductor aquimarinus]MBN8244306.1 hypothetical protein [Nitratireductor aquimarinus]MBY6132696.1 hypothetical protein [Nitratireductor aquimarinus]MCA1304501.1 hypothetical protein [Nitratireductor aquimarinus]
MNDVVKDINGRDAAAVKLQQYQEIYSKLTGRLEKIFSFKRDFHYIKLSDIKNLDAGINQVVNSWDVSSSNLSVSQRLLDGSVSRWSSFEKFELIGSVSGSPTVSLDLEYNFLVKLANNEDPSPFSIKINLRNSLVELAEIRKDNSESADFEIMMSARIATAYWEIQYVDTVVARTVSGRIGEWYDALPQNKEGLARCFVRISRDYIPSFIRFLTSCVVLISFVFFGGGFEVLYNSSYIIYFIFILYLSHIISTPLVSAVVKKVRMVSNFSFVEVSESDRIFFSSELDNSKSLIRRLFVHVFIPIIPSAFVSSLFHFMSK